MKASTRKTVMVGAFVAYNVASIPLALAVAATTPPAHLALGFVATTLLAVPFGLCAIWRRAKSARVVSRRLAGGAYAVSRRLYA